MTNSGPSLQSPQKSILSKGSRLLRAFCREEAADALRRHRKCRSDLALPPDGRSERTHHVCGNDEYRHLRLDDRSHGLSLHDRRSGDENSLARHGPAPCSPWLSELPLRAAFPASLPTVASSIGTPSEPGSPFIRTGTSRTTRIPSSPSHWVFPQPSCSAPCAALKRRDASVSSMATSSSGEALRDSSSTESPLLPLESTPLPALFGSI